MHGGCIQTDNQCYVVRYASEFCGEIKRPCSFFLNFGGVFKNLMTLSLLKYDGVDLTVVVHKVDLQAFSDVIW